MTDIPGTIITAIREAIQQAVLAERERVKSGLQKIEAQMHRDIDAQLEIAKEALEGAIAEQDAAVLAERERCARVVEDLGESLYRQDLMSGCAVREIAAKIRNETADPEPAGQHFDIQAGTFVTYRAESGREAWAKRFANMAARTIEEDRNAMQQRYADPSAQASDIDRNKRG